MEEQKKSLELMLKMEELPVMEGYLYLEPSDLKAIIEERPEAVRLPKLSEAQLGDEFIYGKIYGAWLGRCCGCLLGKPLEGALRGYIVGLLKDTNNYPFKYYVDSSTITQSIKEKYDIIDVIGPNYMRSWINNVNCMPEDDDTNYTILALKLLGEYGQNFTSEDVAQCWLENLPLRKLCTAEAIAYRNFSNLIVPPYSASYGNPFREWIGAQIRGDFFGYINPGKPEKASEMAFRDASISHVKNGIYGEMFVAGSLAAAAVIDDIELVVKCGLSQIPKNSRLFKEMTEVQNWKREGINWETAIDRIHEKYDEKVRHHAVHTIPNALIVCVSLLFSDNDFEKALGISVVAAFDTDCNGATVGSIMGMLLGAQALPAKWTSPLNDNIKSGVDGYGFAKISDLAKKTLDILKASR